MGKGFGNLYYMRNIIYFKVSSYEQKAFGNKFLKTSLMNVFNELKTHGPYFLPFATLGYLHLRWGRAEFERLARKDPNEYKDEDEE